MKKFKEILLWLWQLPQNIAGLIYAFYLKKTGKIGKAISTDYSLSVNASCYTKKGLGGVTLGKYIFISKNYKDSKKKEVIKHECGHVIQSKYLGPLYLLVIGLPSIIHAWLNDYVGCCRKNGKYNYYHFYTEAWANKLIDKVK